jgi:hypothetical protein
MKNWTRADLQKVEAAQKLTQEVIESLIDREGAVEGIDLLIVANEQLARAQSSAVSDIEKHEMALGFAEALRPFAVREEQ